MIWKKAKRMQRGRASILLRYSEVKRKKRTGNMARGTGTKSKEEKRSSSLLPFLKYLNQVR